MRIFPFKSFPNNFLSCHHLKFIPGGWGAVSAHVQRNMAAPITKVSLFYFKLVEQKNVFIDSKSHRYTACLSSVNILCKSKVQMISHVCRTAKVFTSYFIHCSFVSFKLLLCRHIDKPKWNSPTEQKHERPEKNALDLTKQMPWKEKSTPIIVQHTLGPWPRSSCYGSFIALCSFFLSLLLQFILFL